MLGQPEKSFASVLDNFKGERITAEHKYDGVRAQVHVGCGGEVKVFSRHSDETTDTWRADLVPFFEGARPSQYVLDVEVVAVDEGGKIAPFQQLATRKRKLAAGDEAGEGLGEVNTRVYAFDCLVFEGASVMAEALELR